jgi:DNA-binding response OmpR family regulator
VKVASQVIYFANREFELLKTLALQPDTVVAPSTLTEVLWQASDKRKLSNLRVLIYRLKRKLASSEPYRLECIRGRGYGLLSRD